MMKSIFNQTIKKTYNIFKPNIRTIRTLNFGGTKETIVERSDYPKQKIQETFKDDTFAMLGYGTQGRAQALNLRDNGLKVVVGLREGASWDLAKSDGFVEGHTLLPIVQAVQHGSYIMNLLSDAGQKQMWSMIHPQLVKGKTLYFSHGFSIVYNYQTEVVPPADIDVIMVAPKGSGTSVRKLFLEGIGINSSIAVHQDVSGSALENARCLGIAIGSGYLYETTFEKEVRSDLTGERGVLMGAIQGLFMAQYKVLRDNGHSPSEAFNETVEEATQSLYPLIAENGMDWMYANCSTTAQRGALDWYPVFYEKNLPVFEKLYASVKNGTETKNVLEANMKDGYREALDKELDKIKNMEIWQAGKVVRSLRPKPIKISERIINDVGRY